MFGSSAALFHWFGGDAFTDSTTAEDVLDESVDAGFLPNNVSVFFFQDFADEHENISQCFILQQEVQRFTPLQRTKLSFSGFTSFTAQTQTQQLIS